MEFEQVKSQFFRDLQADENVQAAHTEADIRLLFDDLMQFVALVNSASHVTETKKKGNVESSFDHIRTLTQGVENDELSTALEKASHGIQQLLEARRKPIIPHIDDIIEIAYTVGITPKKDRANALAVDIQENQQNQKELIETGNMGGGFFTEAAQEALATVTSSQVPEEAQQALARLLDITSEYMNRSIALRRLGEAESSILVNYLFDETKHTFRQFVKGDFTHATAMWGSDTLKLKRREELSKYFLQQADVDAVKFKTLLIAINMIIRNPNPVESTEKLYDEFMAQYNQWGYIDVHLSRNS